MSQKGGLRGEERAGECHEGGGGAQDDHDDPF